VTLGDQPGWGGRNQEFVAAMLAKLGQAGLLGVTILSGGTDGEDGPTDAAGALGDAETLSIIEEHGYSLEEYLRGHNTYRLFDRVSGSVQNGSIPSGLIRTGLTGTNVMDLRVILVR
jgi:hydroxypyruvate reductase/glycerate 2-kinase